MDTISAFVPSNEMIAEGVGRQLDALYPNRMHRRILMVICLAIFVDFFDLTMGGAIAGALLHNGWSTLFLNSAFFSVAGMGAALGTLIAGFLADRYGRRPALQITLAIMVIGTVLDAFAPSMHWLIAWRLLAAMGMAGVPAVGYTLLTETLPPHIRARWICGAGVFINTSFLVASLTAYWLLPIGAWRLMFAVPSVAGIVIVALIFCLPESPRWLVARGRLSEAFSATNRFLPDSPYPAAGSPPRVVPEPAQALAAPSQSTGFAALFERPMLRRLFLAACLAVAANVVSNGVIAWLPTLMWTAQSAKNGLVQSSIVALGGPVGALAGMYLADRFGRRVGLVGVSGFCAAAALLCAYYAGTQYIVPAALLLFSLISLLLNIVIGVYVPEIFPTSVRARGSSLALTTSRIAMITAPFLVGELVKAGGLAAAMDFFAACLISITIVVAVLGVETANRSLSDI